jgi:hypothetical protein
VADTGFGEIRIELNPNVEKDVEEFVGKGDGAMQVAEKVLKVAISNAPVDSGQYRNSLKVQKTKYGARVVATDQKSAWIEFGIPSRGIPAQFVLRRAAAQLGLTFRKKGR